MNYTLNRPPLSPSPPLPLAPRLPPNLPLLTSTDGDTDGVDDSLTQRAQFFIDKHRETTRQLSSEEEDDDSPTEGLTEATAKLDEKD